MVIVRFEQLNKYQKCHIQYNFITIYQNIPENKLWV